MTAPDARWLLLEPDALLRRTVALTARSLSMGDVREATRGDEARAQMRSTRFKAGLLALDAGSDGLLDLSLLDEWQATQGPAGSAVAVMLRTCTPTLLAELGERGVKRIIVKPFRARVLLDTLDLLLN
jgi:DNA-binding response OmpR family regulator